MLNFENHAFISINATTAAILNGSPPPEAVANGTVVQNIIYKTAESMTIDKAVDIGNKIAAQLGIGYLSAVYGRRHERRPPSWRWKWEKTRKRSWRSG